MKTIYIAGPFRGDNAWLIETNIRHVEAMGLAVARMGAIPLIPHTMYRFFQGTLPDDFWLDATLELLIKCDAIMMCDGWKSSSGSVAELAEAKRLGLAVLFEGDWPELKAWIGQPVSIT